MAVDYNRIGKRIAELRKSRGMTQASLAEKAEITNNFLSHIERSYSIPSLETLVRICDALGVPRTQSCWGLPQNSLPILPMSSPESSRPVLRHRSGSFSI